MTKSKTVRRTEVCLTEFFSKIRSNKKPFLLNVVIRYLHDTNLWHLEYISARLFKILLVSDINSEFILPAFATYIEYLLGIESFEEAKDVTNVLYQILTIGTVWRSIRYTDVTQLLRLYHTTVTTEKNDRLMDVGSCLELCLQTIFGLISSTDLLELVVTMIPLALDTELQTTVSLEFGNLTLEAVIYYMNKGHLSDIPSFLLEYLVESVASSQPGKSYFACKVLARLFDDKKNYNEFLFPKIFYSYMSYNISPSVSMDEKELLLILTYQKPIYHALLLSVKQHNASKKNLNAIYTTICTIIVKVLSGTEAATVVCLLMDMQNFFIESKVMQKVKNYGHGLVLSLMSLYCWIYRGKPLLSYVDTLISKRFTEAQHLLPPSSAVQGSDQMSLKSYQSNKKDLFFDNLELRYALWKCFVTKENIIEVSSRTNLTSDSTTMNDNQNDFQLKLILTYESIDVHFQSK